MCTARRLRQLFPLLASAGAIACVPAADRSATSATVRFDAALSSEPVPWPAEEVARVLGELPPPR